MTASGVVAPPGRPSRRGRRALAGLPLLLALPLLALPLLALPLLATPAPATAQAAGAAEVRERVARLDSLRAAAREAGGPTHAPEAWARAERRAEEARREFREADLADAVEAAEEAARRYREAEVAALRASILGPALTRRRAVEAADAREHAPRTVAEADSLLSAAGRALAAEPRRREEAGTRAALGTALLDRALRLDALADSLDDERLALEALLLRELERLDGIAIRLEVPVDSAAGPASRAESIEAAIRGLASSRAALADSLRDARSRIATLAAERDSLGTVLAAAEERRGELAARIEARERHERRLREIRAIFSPEEGEVSVEDRRLLLRLTGLTFPPGEATILDEHRPILTKVQRVLREFPGAQVTVEGHTDARGEEDRNRALSHERAIAVREHLLQTLPISADRIQAVGYGETRPVSTNDTEEGRARNRRIDVVVELPEAEGL